LHKLAIASVCAVIALATPAAAEEIGECRFDRTTLSFAGTPTEQAACLLRKVKRGGHLREQPLPAVFERLLAVDAPLPTPAQLEAALTAFPEPYQTYARSHAAREVSSTSEGLPLAYFVIHDTSTPFYGDGRFPRHLDTDPRINDFTPYMDGTFAPQPVAHIFLSRYGQIWAGHDFSEGWRATKLESQVIGPRARGRFAHIELVQPRRFAPGSSSLGDTLAPQPGFSKAQYRQLAALYVYASARAGRWLIPAFHAAIDAGLPDAHDDPQNFELEAFAAALGPLLNPARRPPR
jgi:hypothetical protein